ncbi:MAG: hypothetical protein AAF901_03760 [Bacteroidota bacterium]
MTLEEYIKTKGSFYSLREIEVQLGLPSSTLQKVKTSNRKVPKKYRTLVISFLTDLPEGIE